METVFFATTVYLWCAIIWAAWLFADPTIQAMQKSWRYPIWSGFVLIIAWPIFVVLGVAAAISNRTFK